MPIAKINTSQMQAPPKTLNLVLAINKHLKVRSLNNNHFSINNYVVKELQAGPEFLLFCGHSVAIYHNSLSEEASQIVHNYYVIHIAHKPYKIIH